MRSLQDPFAPLPDHDLRARTLRGGAITLGAQMLKFVLQMASTMTLARLLLPSDFGLLAMVTAVTGVLNVLRDGGLASATVQKEVITRQMVSTLFWINAALGVGFALLCVALAPLLGWIYREPKLPVIALALSGTFLVSALTVQHFALLRRQMRFSALAVIDIVSMLAGSGVAIVMAVKGFGYWSLVAVPVVSALASLSAAWIAQPWVPGRPHRESGLLPMLRFGRFLTGSNLVNYFFRNADNVLIGWYWGAGPLGLYTKAYGLLMLPISQINSPMGSVAIPALSRTQSDPERFRRYFLGGYSLVATVVLPSMVALTIFAEDMILLLFGPNWHEAVPLFRLLAPAALIGALLNPFGWMFEATGRPDRQFRLGIAWSALIGASFVIGLPYGPAGVAIGYSAMSCLLAFPLCYYAVQGTPVQLRNLFDCLWVPCSASLIAGAIGILVNLGLPETLPAAVRGLTGCVLVMASYALVLVLVFRRWSYYRNLARDLFPGRFSGRLS